MTTYTDYSTTDPSRTSGWHTVNVGHLVMGLAFLGLVAVWGAVQLDIVPDDVDVQVDAFVDGLGDTSVFGRHEDGFEPRIIDNHDVRDEVAAFTLDADLSVGEIVVHTAREASR